MSVLSPLRKNKQEPEFDESGLPPPVEEPSSEPPTAKRTRSRRKSSARDDEAAVDPVLPEKKRARRRLIGVIALVLAAVIGLPMMLDVEPKPLADDIVVQIPSKDRPAKTNANNVAAAPSSAIDSSLDPKEEVVEQPASPVPANVTAPERSVQPKPAVAANHVPPASTIHDKPKDVVASHEAAKTPAKEKPGQHALAKLDDKPSGKTSEKEVQAKALLEGKDGSKADLNKASTDKKSGKFVIQVAAFATKEKVSELQGKLKDAGIKSYTEKVATDTGGKIRVRVGPFTNKEEADRIRAKLGKLGLNGTLVSA